MAVSVAGLEDQTRAQVLESSCEKSCQVTSEQIKADMKAAAENSKKSSSKGTAAEAGETVRPVVDSVTGQGTRSAGAAARTGVKQVSGPVGRVGPRIATSRHVGGCRREVAETSQRATTMSDRESCQWCTGDDSTREAGVRQSSAPVSGDSLSPTDADVNHAPRRPEQLSGQQERQPVHARSTCATALSLPKSQVRDNDFVPRRPLTRSRTRLSSVSLVPETGKTRITNTEHTHCCEYASLREVQLLHSSLLHFVRPQ